MAEKKKVYIWNFFLNISFFGGKKNGLWKNFGGNFFSVQVVKIILEQMHNYEGREHIENIKAGVSFEKVRGTVP